MSSKDGGDTTDLERRKIQHSQPKLGIPFPETFHPNDLFLNSPKLEVQKKGSTNIQRSQERIGGIHENAMEPTVLIGIDNREKV